MSSSKITTITHTISSANTRQTTYTVPSGCTFVLYSKQVSGGQVTFYDALGATGVLNGERENLREMYSAGQTIDCQGPYGAVVTIKGVLIGSDDSIVIPE